MTRRIALTILFTVWAMLIAGGLTAYLTTRSILLADLDASLIRRALSLQELGPGHMLSLLQPGDRYLVKDPQMRTLSRPATAPVDRPRAALVHASFQPLAGQHRLRTVTLRVPAPVAQPNQTPLFMTVTYSGLAGDFDRLLNRLALGLGVFTAVGGLMATILAAKVARAALRPLHHTAQTIGVIDEANLSRRVEVQRLPPELVPMAQRLNEMLGRLQQAFAQRRQFLADASHELRTPVAALTTTLEVTLRQPRQAEAYRRALESCLGDARMLRRLVDALMHQVRGERPASEEALEEMDIAPLLTECADVAGSLGQDRSIRVVRSFIGPLMCVTAPPRLRSILLNLLANAVEYNKPGGQVELIAAARNGSLHISVSDTGQGISSEDLPHLFEPFFRGHGQSDGQSQHLGLGLALVRAHTQALGGQCTVQSTPGRGSTFNVILPTHGPQRK